MEDQKEEMLDDILIDFFVSVGLPKSMICKIVKRLLETSNDFTSEETFGWLQDYLD